MPHYHTPSLKIENNLNHKTPQAFYYQRRHFTGVNKKPGKETITFSAHGSAHPEPWALFFIRSRAYMDSLISSVKKD